jgi:hypothetical protein
MNYNQNLSKGIKQINSIGLTFITSKCSMSDMLLKALSDNNYEVC